jgi:hypothetical protein
VDGPRRRRLEGGQVAVVAGDSFFEHVERDLRQIALVVLAGGPEEVFPSSRPRARVRIRRWRQRSHHSRPLR